MLLGEDRRRCQERGLPAVHGGDESGAHRDLRLAIAGIAADEPVHWFRRGEVALHCGDRPCLIRRFLVRKGSLKRRDALLLHIVCKPRHDRTFRLRLQKRCGEIGDRALRL